MRLSFAPMRPARRPLTSAKPDPPAAASAGISKMKPHGMAVLTATMTRLGRKHLAESRREPEGRNREDRERAGDRMDDFDHGYATQTPWTSTFWNRCGAATAEDG